MNDAQLQAAAERVLSVARISLFPGVAFDVTDERELPVAAAWLASWVRRVLAEAEQPQQITEEWDTWLFRGAY